MSKITSVEPQKSSYAKAAKRRGIRRFNIFLDGEFAFGADEDLVVSYRLVSGKIIDQKELEKLIFESEVGKLMERMYGLFSVRQRSEKEVRDYFRIKNLESRIKGKEEKSQLVVDLLIERLKTKGMINDVEFAGAWVEGRRKSKNKSNRALKAELNQKGIDREIIEEVFRLPTPGFSEEELAAKALEKKMKAWKNLPPLEFKKKAYEYLLRQGFGYSVIRLVVENILQKG